MSAAALAALLAGSSLVVGGAAANAAPAPTTITTTGAFSSIAVPAGVCSVTVNAIGGGGGSPSWNGTGAGQAQGGAGASITATYPVTPGMEISGFVGGGGQGGQGLSGNTQTSGGANTGGAGGNGTLHHGGAGGGLTSVSINGDEVIVAGGGGGAGGGHRLNEGWGGHGGLPSAFDVVAAGQDGAAGGDSSDRGNGPTYLGDPTMIPGGGQGGQAAAPGTGGGYTDTDGKLTPEQRTELSGAAGSGRQGGKGGLDIGSPSAADRADTAGGGGGGYFGGGGGSGTRENGAGDAIAGGIGAGGGGGGASWASASGGSGTASGLASAQGARAAGGATGANGSVVLTWGDCTPPTTDNGTTEGPAGNPQRWTPTPAPGTLPIVPGSVRFTGGVNEIVVPGVGRYTTDGTEITFTPAPGYTGTPDAVGYLVTDESGLTATGTYQPTVTAPLGSPDASSDQQGQVQEVDPLANDASDTFTPDPSTLRIVHPQTSEKVTELVVPGVGRYEVVAGKIRFTPEPSYTGTAQPVTYSVSNIDGVEATSTYTPTVIPVTPGAHPDTSYGPQGVPQSIDPLGNDLADPDADPEVPLDPSTLTLLDADGEPVDSVTVPGQGVYTISQGKIVFTPEKAFVGIATPVDYRVQDENGTPAESTYTPEFFGVVPSASADTTRGPQGAPQTRDVVANDQPGHAEVPLDGSSLTLLSGSTPVSEIAVPGEGTYTVVDGRIRFQPEPFFTGTATPVDYRISDVNGSVAASTYTPTVDPIAKPDESHGVQGVTQTRNPLSNDGGEGVELDPSTLRLVDPATTQPVDTVTVPGQGTYRVVDGKIEFQPEPQFTGDASGVRYLVDDTEGNTLGSTYTPHVTGVEPGANPDATSGPQGVPQSIDPLANDRAGDPQVPLDPATLTLLDAEGEPAESVTIPGQGVYTVVDGRIVFTPEPQFTGTATPVDYRVADRNGTPTASTYTPNLTPVAPVANPDRAAGEFNKPVSYDPFANDRPGDPEVPLDRGSLQLLENGEPVDRVEVPEGIYTIEDGLIVFTPKLGFSGTATPVDYRIADVNGTPAESTFTPVIEAPAPITKNDEQTRKVGEKVVFDTSKQVAGFDPTSVCLVDAKGAHVTRLVVNGEGVWTADPATGLITFTPEAGFRSKPTPQNWCGMLLDGTPVTGELEITYLDERGKPAPLARTGSDSVFGLGLGAALAALAGAGAWVAGRRRRL